MLRVALIGVWVILVTAGATFASVYLARGTAGEAGTSEDLGIEEMKSELTSVPVIRGGDVVGYLILQLSFAANRGLLNQKKIDPMPFMTDAAFRVIFTSNDMDFQRLRPGDLNKLTDAILAEANRRIGSPLVQQVLLQQLNFVRKEDIRTKWIGGNNAAN